MKKQIRLIAVMALTAILLVGCGKSQSKTSNGEQTRTIQTTSGKVKVPVHPKRVVSSVYTGEVLSLGVHVVGSTSLDLANPYLSSKTTKQIKNLGSSLNSESVLKLKPDLIITSTQSDVKKLKKIAPVVYIPYGSTGNVYKTLAKFGNILNKTKKAQSVKRDLQQTVQSQTKQLQKAGIDPSKTTVGMYEMQDNKFYVDGASWGRGGEALVNGLGFKLPNSIEKIQNGAGYKQISTESLGSYAADWMFFTSYSSTKKGNDQAVSDLKNNVVWQQQPAVKAGHVISLPFNKMYYYDPAAVKGQMKLITQAMIKAN